jgi:ADP-ribosylglycohydrolase
LTGYVALHDPAWPRRPAILGRKHPPGIYTDDTQMTLAVAEALIEAGRADLDTLMGALALRFVAWCGSPGNNRAPGAACVRACHNLAAGVPWDEAGVAGSKGCGANMRVAPIGLFFEADHPRLLEVARAQTKLTHRHAAAAEGAAAAALLVAMALQGNTPEALFAAALAECAPRSPDFKTCFEKLPALREADPALALSAQGLGEGWVAEEAVASALWCHWRAPTDFRACVLLAVNTDGDSDSIACIAGGISAAANGLESIPAEWIEGIENRDGLRDVARRLHAASIESI